MVAYYYCSGFANTQAPVMYERAPPCAPFSQTNRGSDAVQGPANALLVVYSRSKRIASHVRCFSRLKISAFPRLRMPSESLLRLT